MFSGRRIRSLHQSLTLFVVAFLPFFLISCGGPVWEPTDDATLVLSPKPREDAGEFASAWSGTLVIREGCVGVEEDEMYVAVAPYDSQLMKDTETGEYGVRIDGEVRLLGVAYQGGGYYPEQRDALERYDEGPGCGEALGTTKAVVIYDVDEEVATS